MTTNEQHDLKHKAICDASDAGEQAFHDGLDEIDNPHPFATTLSEYWALGFDDAAEDSDPCDFDNANWYDD